MVPLGHAECFVSPIFLPGKVASRHVLRKVIQWRVEIAGHEQEHALGAADPAWLPVLSYSHQLDHGLVLLDDDYFLSCQDLLNQARQVNFSFLNGKTWRMAAVWLSCSP